MMIEVVMIVFMMMIIVMMKVNSISQEYLNDDIVLSRSHPFSLPPQVYIHVHVCIYPYIATPEVARRTDESGKLQDHY